MQEHLEEARGAGDPWQKITLAGGQKWLMLMTPSVLVRSQTSWHGGGSAHSVVFLIPCRRSVRQLLFGWLRVENSDLKEELLENFLPWWKLTSFLQKGSKRYLDLKILKFEICPNIIKLDVWCRRACDISRQSCHHVSLVAARKAPCCTLQYSIRSFAQNSYSIIRLGMWKSHLIHFLLCLQHSRTGCIPGLWR